MIRLKILAFLVASQLAVAALQGASSGWVVQGCWSPYAYGTCYDVFTDSTGAYWRCAACGTTKNPSSHTCFGLNPSTGFWCS